MKLFFVSSRFFRAHFFRKGLTKNYVVGQTTRPRQRPQHTQQTIRCLIQRNNSVIQSQTDQSTGRLLNILYISELLWYERGLRWLYLVPHFNFLATSSVGFQKFRHPSFPTDTNIISSPLSSTNLKPVTPPR